MTRIAATVGVLVLMTAAIGVGEEQVRLPTEAEPGHLEVPDQPPALVKAADTAPAVEVERDGVFSVQVNVTSGGANILGDAANEPSIAVDPTAPNRMAIGWRQFDDVSSNFRQAGRAFSDDGGRTWTFPGVLEPGVFRSDPVLASDRHGRLYYYSLRSSLRCDIFVSDDGGRSWSGRIPAWGGDKEWLVVDDTGGPGDGNLYASWSTEGNPWGRRIFTRSVDRGASFSDPIVLEPAPVWGSMAVGPDGELYIGGNRDFDLTSFVVLRSTDAWDAEAEPSFDVFVVDLGGSQRGQGLQNPQGLLGQVWIGVDRSDGPLRGTVYLVASVDPPGPDRMDVHLVRSTNGGETWSEPVRIHPDDRGAHQWFATMSVAPGGRLDVVWIESLDAASPERGELTYASSEDGGYSWSTPVAVSPVFDSTVGWPQQNKMGDYFHMVSDDVGADLAWAATFNDEQDVYYTRLGDRDCDRNGVGDTKDLTDGVLRDCDADGIPDLCAIAAGTAVDADRNGRPDVCQQPRVPSGRLVPGE